MANLSDLVESLSRVSGVPKATVFAYGRFARQAGAIAQKGRGRGAASMKLEDAANLLIALGGTDVTKEAGKAVKAYRPLRGHILADSADEIFLDWLRPKGLKSVVEGGFEFYELQISFGSFVESLIEQFSSGELLRFLKRVPVVDGSSAENKQSANTERGISEGTKKKSPGQIRIGRHENPWVTIVFDQTACTAEVFIHRSFMSATETPFSIFFRRSPPSPQKGDRNVTVIFTLNSVAALATALEGRAIPAKLRSREQFLEFFFPSASSSVQKLQGGTR